MLNVRNIFFLPNKASVDFSLNALSLADTNLKEVFTIKNIQHQYYCHNVVLSLLHNVGKLLETILEFYFKLLAFHFQYY